MTEEEAKNIYKNWKANIEILDKILKVFHVIPESFLPYNIETLEEALNIVAKDYFDMGDKRTAKNIQEILTLHVEGLYYTPEGVTGRKMTDEEALMSMKKKLHQIFENPELKTVVLKNLKEARKSWANLK
jgi:hypothetical protein